MGLINFNECGKVVCNSMKKLSFIIFAFTMLISCDIKTPEQRAKEAFEAEKQAGMRHEIYIDSVLNVALGKGKYEYMPENRRNAIKILRKELPAMNDKWDILEQKIYQH